MEDVCMKNVEPERGAAYPIVLGSTLKEECSSEFMLVQYNFQPNTISRAANGCLSLEHHRTADRGDASHAKVSKLATGGVAVLLCACMCSTTYSEHNASTTRHYAGKRATGEHARY